MPRKPNYRFERMERERRKAEKKAARAQAKAERAEARKLEDTDAENLCGPETVADEGGGDEDE